MLLLILFVNKFIYAAVFFIIREYIVKSSDVHTCSVSRVIKICSNKSGDPDYTISLITISRFSNFIGYLPSIKYIIFTKIWNKSMLNVISIIVKKVTHILFCYRYFEKNYQYSIRKIYAIPVLIIIFVL